MLAFCERVSVSEHPPVYDNANMAHIHPKADKTFYLHEMYA